MLEQRVASNKSHLADQKGVHLAARPLSPGLRRERVIKVQHYTDKLFSFKTSRASSFRFQSGQFAMIGLEMEERPLLRAYSMTSAVYDDWLEFFSIKVPNGPLTSRLQRIEVGEEIIVNAKPTGTLLTTNLRPGRHLWLFSTGTGFAPFASIIRDAETYSSFEKVIVVEGCRQLADLQFSNEVIDSVLQHEYLGEIAAGKLIYYPTITREAFVHNGRIPDLIVSGRIFTDTALPPLEKKQDRIMICGNPAMLSSLKKLIEDSGFEEGSNSIPGDFVIEKAFVEK